MREAEADGEAVQAAVDDCQHLAVVGPQEGEVVKRCLRRPDHLVCVLDGEPRPRRVVELLGPLDQLQGRPRRRVEQARRVGVGVVEGDDDGAAIERG